MPVDLPTTTPPESPHRTTPNDPSRPPRRLTAKDAVVAVLVAAILLVVLDGDGIRRTGEKMDEGLGREVVLAVGHPAGWVADQLPFASAADQVTGWFATDEDLGSDDGEFSTAATTGVPSAGGAATGGGAVARVSPTEFAGAGGAGAAAKRPLRTLLVTGDSMVQPMDSSLARELTEEGVRTIREAKIGTGISKTDLLDWGRFSQQQAAEHRADAVVVFLGANEGFPMPTPGAGTVECCGPEWAAEYATRVRSMMAAYSRGGEATVYWTLLPAARDRSRTEIIETVNEAIRVAAAPFGDDVRLLDVPDVFTPRGAYRDTIDGEIVRDADGIHLNGRGADIAADLVIGELREAYDWG